MAMQFNSGYALTIGIGDYQNLSKLAKSPADAQDLADLLVRQCGYPQEHVASLINGQATKTAINAKLEWLARRTQKDDTVVIFFSGHGAQRLGGFEPGEYLCPVETDFYNLRTTGISSEEFSTALRAIPARKVAVFFDACHSGGVGEIKDAALKVKAGLSEQQYERMAEGEGRVIIASCRPDEVSWELGGMRNGLFTHYLLEGLRGAAAEATGEVSILTLFQYTAKRVKAHGQQIGITQTPWVKAATEDFVVAIGTRATPPPELPSMTNQEQKAGSDDEMNDCESIKQQLAMARRSLNILEVQAAGYTALTIPAHLQIEIEEQRRKVETLEQKLRGCQNSPSDGVPVNWTQFADSLLRILSQIPALDHYENRSGLLNGLPPGPSGFINRSNAKNADLRSIIGGAKGMGELTSGEHALVIVARNALDFVTGLLIEEDLKDLLASISRMS